jgi:hypothetical protein
MSIKKDRKKLKEAESAEVIIGKRAGLDLNVCGFNVIEPGIRNLVYVLHRLGFTTICSCAGHVKALEPLPWVAISTLPANLSDRKLGGLMIFLARFNLSQGKNGKLPRASDTWVLSPQVVGNELLLFLRPQSLNERRSFAEIQRLRELGIKLASFLLRAC